MEGLRDLNLIRFLSFYYALMFCAGTWRRFSQYREMGKLVVSGPGRWPRLMGLVRAHGTIFLTWRTVAPAVLALLLWAVQVVASTRLWPEAAGDQDGLSVARLLQPPLAYYAAPVVLVLAVAVLALDVYFFISVGEIDRPMLEKYFDQAEYWLGSPAAHVVKFFTFGYVNPRRMVTSEVRKALVEASNLANSTLWWVSVQIGLRFLFGLSLWLTWALGFNLQ